MLTPATQLHVEPMLFVLRGIERLPVLVYLDYKEIRTLSANLSVQSTKNVPLTWPACRTSARTLVLEFVAFKQHVQ